MKWITRNIKKIFRKDSQVQSAFELPMDKAEGMIKMIESTLEVELSCDEVKDLMGEYAEMVMRGDDVDKLMPLVLHHLTLCQNCREEFDAVLRILQSASDHV